MNPFLNSDEDSAKGSDHRGVSPLDWPRDNDCVEAVTRSIERHARQRRQRQLWSACAAVAFGLIVGARAWRTIFPGNVVSVANDGVIVSSPARQTLPDGSVIELRGDAQVRVDFQAGVRRVILERGAVHFQVAKDASRPFLVVAGAVGVRAVGTAFLVEHDTNAVEVVVTEGRVAVAPAASLLTAEGAQPESAPVLLAAGQRTVVDLSAASAAAPAMPVSAQELRERLGWRIPRLEFNGTALSRVLELVNDQARRSGSPELQLADPSLADLPLSGMLRADNIGALLKILESSYQVGSSREEGRILLHRSTAP